jgi:hypothetical protein
VTELDQAPATTATETADQPAAGEQRPGSHDSQARYPNTVSAADADPGYYDGDIQAALAADTTPTRQQAFRDAAAHDQASDAAARRDPADSGRDPDVDAILHENDHLPDPRTRQQAARDAAAHDQADGDASATSREAPPGGRDPDIEAILHENDGMPDPRTRQQAARDAVVETSPANRNDISTATGDHRASGPVPLTRGDSDNIPAKADPAPDQAAAAQATPERRGPGHADRDQRVDVVRTRPEDRTLGDTTPTGIGLKPTGDQLLGMESDDPTESRLDRFLRKATEEADDLHDGVGNAAEAIHDFRLSPGGAAQAYEGHGGHDHPAPPDSQGVSDMVGGVALVTVAMVTAARQWIWNRRKEAGR